GSDYSAITINSSAPQVFHHLEQRGAEQVERASAAAPESGAFVEPYGAGQERGCRQRQAFEAVRQGEILDAFEEQLARPPPPCRRGYGHAADVQLLPARHGRDRADDDGVADGDPDRP